MKGRKKTFEMLSGLTPVNVSWILEIKSILRGLKNVYERTESNFE